MSKVIEPNIQVSDLTYNMPHQPSTNIFKWTTLVHPIFKIIHTHKH